MTIVARLNSLMDAYAGIEALRMHSIPPSIAKHGEQIVITVDDDFAKNAQVILTSDGRFSDEQVCCDITSSHISYDDHNA
jgi:hypothetical protein